MTKTEKISEAARHIGATRLRDGAWAYYADETSRWYVVSDDDLMLLRDIMHDDDPDVSRDPYSHWCASTSAEEMPKGWSPDQVG